jgi:nitronate monooxygenase
MAHPKIIQGGMGVGVSAWHLARAVSQCGQLGVVSGTALDVVLARRLQLGDPGGHMRRACQHFPVPAIAQRVLDQFFIPDGKPCSQPHKRLVFYSLQPPARLTELAVLANFVEVFLAKEDHEGVVGINYLEKIQLPTLPALYGAMLAGVDYILMGAGIPRAIPGIMDLFAQGQAAKLHIDVAGALAGEEYCATFDPQTIFGGSAPVVRRPEFLAIVSSATLAIALARKSSGRVNGFVVEGSTAGGHNAPPRGALQLNTKGEPIYGEKDLPDLEKIKAIGLPFWLAGSYGNPQQVAAAFACGAAGVQVGTAFAFSEDSGIAPEIRAAVIEKSRHGTVTVFTDPVASPTGFPFKVVELEGSLSGPELYAERPRICDLGYLRHVYRQPNGTVGYRCPSEPVDDYVQKGGDIADTIGRKCLCNTLAANVGLEQYRPATGNEKPMLTAGDDAVNVAQFLKPGCDTYTAADVIEYLLPTPTPRGAEADAVGAAA